MRAAVAASTLLFALSCGADTAVTGYIKSYAIAQDKYSLAGTSAPRQWQSQNSVRLMFDHVGDSSAWQLHYEISPVFASHPLAGSTGQAGSGAWRLSDPDRTLAESDKSVTLQNLDRLNVQFNFDAGDLTIGRQPITFGMARVINPTDVFLPYDVRTLNTEYRVGVDAVRFQAPFGQLSEFDVGVIVGPEGDSSRSAAFMQVRTNVAGKDLQFALTRFAGQTLVGGGVQMALGDFGYWLEAAGVRGPADYTRVSTGLDYAFTENIFGLVEYHYNGAGSDSPTNYLARLTTAPYTSGSVFLLGKHYLIPAVTVQLSTLWSLSVQSITNLSDESAFLSVSMAYNVSQNIYMDFGYYHFVGDEAAATSPVPQPGSEYGHNPATLYASVRYYF